MARSRPIPLPTRQAIPVAALWASSVWALRAEGVKPLTVVAYAQAKDAFTTYATEHGMPTAPALVARHRLEEFMTEQVETMAPNTARNRFRALSRFYRWQVDEEEIPVSPMARMKAPRVVEQPPEVLTIDELRATTCYRCLTSWWTTQPPRHIAPRRTRGTRRGARRHPPPNTASSVAWAASRRARGTILARARRPPGPGCEASSSTKRIPMAS